MLVKVKLQFKGFDNATQPQKPHWESVRDLRLLFLTELRLFAKEFGHGGRQQRVRDKTALRIMRRVRNENAVDMLEEPQAS